MSSLSLIRNTFFLGTGALAVYGGYSLYRDYVRDKPKDAPLWKTPKTYAHLIEELRAMTSSRKNLNYYDIYNQALRKEPPPATCEQLVGEIEAQALDQLEALRGFEQVAEKCFAQLDQTLSKIDNNNCLQLTQGAIKRWSDYHKMRIKSAVVEILTQTPFLLEQSKKIEIFTKYLQQKCNPKQADSALYDLLK